MTPGGHKNRTLASHEVLRPEERSRLFLHLEGQLELAKKKGSWRARRDAVFCLLLLSTGIRVGAACQLRVGDAHVQRGKRELRVSRAKGGKPRTVRLPDEMRAALSDYLATMPEAQADAALLAKPEPMSRTTGWRRWKRALAAVGLDMEGRGCHAARHGLGLALWKKRGDLRVVAAQLGHSDLRSTMIYTAPLPEDVEAALDETWCQR